MHPLVRTLSALSFLLFVSAAAPTRAAELTDCLAEPGVQDEFGFTHRIEVLLEQDLWYFMAPELELNFDQRGQAQDLPGHCWHQGPALASTSRFLGKHFNTGPLGAGGEPRFWSSDAEDHEQLYWVDLLIAPWTPKVASQMAREGYVHYHELVLAEDGCIHPNLVAWMRHSALKAFTFDGGPPQKREDGRPFRPRNVAHEVQPGIDLNFPPNYDIPHQPHLICLPE